VNLPKGTVRVPGFVEARLVLPVSLAALLMLAVGGCGGGDDNGGGTDPASLAPAQTPFYVEATILPEGEAKANVDALAKAVAGVDNLGGLIESEIEKSASEEGEDIDFEAEIKPWLGEKGAVFSPEYKEGDFSETVVAIQVTDAGEAESFIDQHAKSNGEPDEDGSYAGIDFKVQKDDGQTIGIVNELLVIADSEGLFKQVVDTSKGESLADESTYSGAVSNVPDASAADVYVDIGGLIEQADEIDPEMEAFLETVGIEPREATAVASVIPGSGQLEIDISTNVSDKTPPSVDATELLGALPGNSVAVLGSPEFGKRFEEGIDTIDAHGIPGQVPPNQLKKALKQSGIDVESIASGIGNVALFVEGSNRRNLGGALVLEAEDPQQATNTVSNIGLLLRASGTPGVTALSGKVSGFSIRSPELGRRPVVVASEGDWIAISYGPRAATAVLGEQGETLAENSTYGEAAAALGSTPISGFVDGPAALKLISSLVPPDDEGFREAKRYLTKIDYLALGAEASGGLTTAKLIVGVGG
jgi:Protein of unknown function (DUF3352)